MWAILSFDGKRGGKWSPEEFFATGRKQIEEALRTIEETGMTVNHGNALDFGCGLGRLSQALAKHFEHVDGVDVSESMIQQAPKFNQFGDRVQYHLNVRTDLSLFPRGKFDFIFSSIVLQHIPTKHQLLYIAEFMDLLAPGGVAYFQTVRTHGLRAFVPNWFVESYRKFKNSGKTFIPMYGVESQDVERIVRKHGCHLHKRVGADFGEWSGKFASETYLIVKRKS